MNLTPVDRFLDNNDCKHEIIAGIYRGCRGIIKKSAGYFVNLKENK